MAFNPKKSKSEQDLSTQKNPGYRQLSVSIDASIVQPTANGPCMIRDGKEDESKEETIFNTQHSVTTNHVGVETKAEQKDAEEQIEEDDDKDHRQSNKVPIHYGELTSEQIREKEPNQKILMIHPDSGILLTGTILQVITCLRIIWIQTTSDDDGHKQYCLPYRYFKTHEHHHENIGMICNIPTYCLPKEYGSPRYAKPGQHPWYMLPKRHFDTIQFGVVRLIKLSSTDEFITYDVKTGSVQTTKTVIPFSALLLDTNRNELQWERTSNWYWTVNCKLEDWEEKHIEYTQEGVTFRSTDRGFKYDGCLMISNKKLGIYFIRTTNYGVFMVPRDNVSFHNDRNVEMWGSLNSSSFMIKKDIDTETTCTWTNWRNKRLRGIRSRTETAVNNNESMAESEDVDHEDEEKRSQLQISEQHQSGKRSGKQSDIQQQPSQRLERGNQLNYTIAQHRALFDDSYGDERDDDDLRRLYLNRENVCRLCWIRYDQNDKDEWNVDIIFECGDIKSADIWRITYYDENQINQTYQRTPGPRMSREEAMKLNDGTNDAIPSDIVLFIY